MFVWEPTTPDAKPGRNDDYWDRVVWIIDKATDETHAVSIVGDEFTLPRSVIHGLAC